ncbi:MAG: NAD(P)H-binding protein [Allosphingosinicella sp.]
MAQRILLIGATGLVGGLAVRRLEAAGHDVRTFVRGSTGRGEGETVAPALQWPALVRSAGGDVAICAIGTTMRKAGSQAAFRAVDFDMAVDFARAAREAGVPHMIAISSVGADARSRNFYLRTKGEMEEALRAMGFDRLDLLRPGLLRGDRGPERRLGERLAILASPLVNLVLRGRLDRYAAIDASLVAAAVAKLAERDERGTFIHHNSDIRDLLTGV